MKIVIASDHAGFKLKEEVKSYLSTLKDVKFVDYGTFSEDSVDYPDYGFKAAGEVSNGHADRAILFCGSGIGMCMVANRLKNVRAVVLRSDYDAIMSRRHNDANVACLGGRVTSFDEAVKWIDIWFKTPFEGGRHERRVKKIG